MSSGEFLYFGAACPTSSSLPHISPSVRYNNPFLVSHEQNKLILPPPATTTPDDTDADAHACIAVKKICGDSFVLLEDGQVYDLDGFTGFEPWVGQAFDALNRLRMPIVDIAIGGRAPTRNSTTSLSAAVQGAGGHFFLCLTATGELWVFGSNSFGQLGLGHARADVRTPTRVDKFAPETTPASNIAVASRSSVACSVVGVAAGDAHSLALTADGSLYAWGRNAEGQLGLVPAARLRALQQELNEFDGTAFDRARLVDAVAAEASRVSSRTANLAYAAAVLTPRFVHHLADVPLARVAASQHNSAVVSSDGRVFAWGYGLFRGQASVPTQVTFEDATSPRVREIALGHAHAILLDEEGIAYAIGSSLSGALGLGGDVEKLVESARRIPVAQGDDTAIVQVATGAFYSALLDARGRVHTFGTGSNGQLGGVVGESQFDSPRTLVEAGAKVVGLVSCGPRRLLLFVPTRIADIVPGVAALVGGTRIELSGDGFATRGSDEGQILASLVYSGQTRIVPATYDAARDILQFVAPAFDETARGGVYRDAHLASCVVRVSFDAGQHFSNALALRVFRAPEFDNQDQDQDDEAEELFESKTDDTPSSVSVTPSFGPLEGGSSLALRAPFDVVPYERVLVRFRVGDTSGAVIATVPATFDPLSSCVRVAAPNVPSSLVPASAPPPASPQASRFKRTSVAPPTSCVSSQIEVSLDGGDNFFAFPRRFRYFALATLPPPTASGVVPPAPVQPTEVGLAGGSLRIRVSGAHFTRSAHVRLLVGSHVLATVPAVFQCLNDARSEARALRERNARFERKRRADAAESARLAAIQAAIDEEANRDPKERDRLAREREKAEAAREKEATRLREKEAAQAKKDAAAAAAAAERASRPSSATSNNGREALSRPRSSAGANKSRPESRAATPTKDRSASPANPSPAVAQGVTAVENAPAPESPQAANAAAPTASPPAPVEPDEFDLEEARIAAEEAAEDKILARLSARDRAATGYLCCETGPLGSFGAQAVVALSVSLNGGRDFVPLANAHFAVRAPVPISLSPACGPREGGTLVSVVGDFFYQAREIAVQLRHSVLATANALTRPNSANELETTKSARATGGTASGASSAAMKRAAAGSSARRDASATPAVEVPPLASPPAQTLPARYEVVDAAAAATLAFETPSWPIAGVVGTHVAFDPSENAFSGEATSPSSSASPTSSSFTAPSSSSPSLPLFRFYDPPVVLDAHPPLVSQVGGTEVTLTGRGFVPTRECRVRLVLPDEDPEKKAGGHRGAPPPPAASTTDGDATPHGAASSARRKLVAASAHAASVEEAATVAARRKLLPRVDLPATYHANDASEEDAHRKRTGPGASGKRRDGGADADPEPATLTFLSPAAGTLLADFGVDGGVSPAGRALEIEVALNGQQFVSTGLFVRFEKDGPGAGRNKKRVGDSTSNKKK